MAFRDNPMRTLLTMRIRSAGLGMRYDGRLMTMQSIRTLLGFDTFRFDRGVDSPLVFSICFKVIAIIVTAATAGAGQESVVVPIQHLGRPEPAAMKQFLPNGRLWKHAPMPRPLLDVSATHAVTEIAVIEIAKSLDLISRTDEKWLKQELGIDDAETSSEALETPRWDRDRGRLTYKGELVRIVRPMRTRSRVQIILDAFDDAGWETIESPFDVDPMDIHDIVRQVNDGLVGIKFHAGQLSNGATTMEIYWTDE